MHSFEIEGNTADQDASVFKTFVVAARFVFKWGCHTTDARAGGRELIGGGALQYGRTPLCMAAWKGNAAVAQMLLRAGANKDAKYMVRERREGEDL